MSYEFASVNAAPISWPSPTDWIAARNELEAQGWVRLPQLLPLESCATLIKFYDEPERFRSSVVMGRHGFGSGEYQYFRYPLPDLVQTLREALYPELKPVADRWRAQRGQTAYPEDFHAFRARCHSAGQTRPTPLILKYGAGDFNRLHQDLYGKVYFPLQVAVLLSKPGEDFEGGEFVLTEQKPRSQSRADVVALDQGDAVVFAVNDRPVAGARRPFTVRMRHGVSRVRSGVRFMLGVIFHDAA